MYASAWRAAVAAELRHPGAVPDLHHLNTIRQPVMLRWHHSSDLLQQAASATHTNALPRALASAAAAAAGDDAAAAAGRGQQAHARGRDGAHRLSLCVCECDSPQQACGDSPPV
jgi:hypothetical protein